MPKFEYLKEFLLSGKLQFQNPYENYKGEINLFYQKETDVLFKIDKLFVSCFTVNKECYFNMKIWDDHGGKESGFCLGFHESLCCEKSTKFLIKNSKRIYATNCGYYSSVKINGDPITLDLEEIDENYKSFVYLVPKESKDEHEKELRLFCTDNSKANDIMIDINKQPYFYLNNLVIGNKNDVPLIYYEIQRIKTTMHFKIYTVNDERNKLNYLGVV